MGRLAIAVVLTTLLVLSTAMLGDRSWPNRVYPNLMICTLCRNKAHALPYFLGHLENLHYPKDRIHLFIRTDHNHDETGRLLKSWVDVVEHLYGSIDFEWDNQMVSYDGERNAFDWPDERYRRVINLKELAFAKARRLRYQDNSFEYLLFLDCDNFLTHPNVITHLMAEEKTIIAPMLHSTAYYSNFWAGVNEHGYYKRTEDYEPIYYRKMRGCMAVPMVHSTLLIDLKDTKTNLLTFDPNKSLDEDAQLPLDDVIVFARSAAYVDLDLYILNTEDFGCLLLPQDLDDPPNAEIESMRYLLLEEMFNGPPGLLYSPYVKPKLPPKDEPGKDFDHVYVINLKRRPERRQRMRWCLDVLGLNATFLDAVDGKLLSDEYVLQDLAVRFLPGYKDPFYNRTMTKGEIGCFLSHYRIWQDVVKQNYRQVLIFEDDLRFTKNFRMKLKTIMADVRSAKLNWDLMYLGRKRLNSNLDGPEVPNVPNVWLVGYSYWTISYALTNSGARKLLDARPLDNLLPVDEYLPIMFDKHPNLDWKSFYPVRDLQAFTTEPLLITPTHYTGESGYISDTENAVLAKTSVKEIIGPMAKECVPPRGDLGSRKMDEL